MKKPARQGDAFLEEVHATPNDPDRFDVWWLGQSGFLVKYNGKYLLFDPYLSDSLTKKYADTEKPHARMTGRVIEPERLDFIDVVTSTHNHTDHLDAETLLPLKEANPNLKLVLPTANIEFAADRLQCKPDWFVGMNDGDEKEVAGFTFHAIPAAHEELDMDENGNHKYLGYIVNLGGTDKHGNNVVYHSGDTVRYEGLAERLKRFDIHMAFMPINGSRPERKVPGNMWGHEAVQLAADTGIPFVIPCHFDMFEFNTVSPDAFEKAAIEKDLYYAVLENGERITSSSELQD